MGLLRQWWDDPGHYLWLIEFLRPRGLVGILKGGIGAAGVLMAVALACLLAEGLQPPSVVTHGMVAALLVGTCGWVAYWWVRPWPTARVSVGLFLGADLAITTATVVHSDPLAALSTTPLFAMTGAYLVFFHGPRAHLVHVGLATATIVGTAEWLGLSAHPDAVPLAVSKALIAVTVTVGVLPFTHFGFWLVRHSSVDSFSDPLTALANRRGLANFVDSRVAQLRSASQEVCTLVIDLDDFKSVNDRHGHQVGDAVIVRTAARIRSAVRGSALVARIGGEEFVVIDMLCPAAAAGVAERVRTAIAAPGEPLITASIGVATGHVFDAVQFDTLFAVADRAMYAAKRNGGNQVVRSEDVRDSRVG